MRINKPIILFISTFLLLSCDKGNRQESAVPEKIQNKGLLLAEVNGVGIHEQDLENVLLDMFGQYQAAMLDAKGRKRALESLVASHALADMSVKKLKPEQLSMIEDKAKRYRENLLINAYVKKTIVPEPVSNEMVENYYNSHLEKFGQKNIRQYELLSTKTVLPAELRDKFLTAFNKINRSNMKNIPGKLNKQGYQLQYHKGVLGETKLQAKIRDLISAQKLNMPSNITFIEGKAYMVNVYAENTKSAKPLGTVSKDIRKSLAMIQLKKSIKTLSETAVKQATVVYHNNK